MIAQRKGSLITITIKIKLWLARVILQFKKGHILMSKYLVNYFIVIPIIIIGLFLQAFAQPTARWSPEKANAWFAEQAWPVGFNYMPRYAINQLEMWQEDTFDLKIIDEEFSWAKSIGYNTARVFLHDQLWQQDSKGFIKRIEKFLTVADKHDIKIMLVFFDDVWDPNPQLGKQKAPTPGVHNSGWVQSPGKAILGNMSKHDSLKPYVQGIIRHFANDKRILIWDLYNEPANLNKDSYGDVELENKIDFSLALLEKTFLWAREVNPSQPLTVDKWFWRKGNKIDAFALNNSDIISYHDYSDPKNFKRQHNELLKLGRPIICTEYMARTNHTFADTLPLFARHKTGALQWGFVSGKSQTIYPWATWKVPLTEEPELWFHDLLRDDGTPYIDEEVDLIREIIKQK